MHVHVNMKADNKALFFSLVYADNYYIDRRALWTNLNMHSRLMKVSHGFFLGDLMRPLTWRTVLVLDMSQI